MANTYLDQARVAYKNDDYEKAQTYYALAYEADPEDAEARYFAAYLNVVNASAVVMYEKTFAYIDTVKILLKSLLGEEKDAMLAIIIKTSESITQYVHKVMWEHSKEIKDSQELLNKYNKERNACEKACIEMLYLVGDTAAESEDEDTKKLSADAWKSAIAAQQLYPYCRAEKTLPATYAEKVKVIDPNYVLPKKAGCISFS